MSSKLQAKALKTNRPDFSFENSFSRYVCGLDEVGRAPLAGPVVAACVYIPTDKMSAAVWSHVNDSKTISLKKRESLFDEIKSQCCWAIAESSPREIEELNILQASFLAMRRAFDICFLSSRVSAQLDEASCKFQHGGIPPLRVRDEVVALIDGHIAPFDFPCATQSIIKGDLKSVSIASASIIAKVYRDRLMTELSKKHPHYGWESNAGYPTRAHLEGIQKHGITAHHRKTFAPVRNFIEFGSVTPQLKLAV